MVALEAVTELWQEGEQAAELAVREGVPAVMTVQLHWPETLQM
jgi:hypothetical protein